MSRLFRLWVILPMVGAGLVLAGGAAHAAEPGPIQIPLAVFPGRDPGPVQCPGGTYVAVTPGRSQSAVFVLQDPGPIQCPAGIDVLRDPGPINLPAVQNEAVALPLTAADCAQGIALFNQELALLGVPGTSPVGTAASAPGTNDPCPGGTAALAALHGALANVPVAPGTFGLAEPGPINRPGGFVLAEPGPVQVPGVVFSYVLDRSGTPRGLWLEQDPGPISRPTLLVLVPSGTPGVSRLRDPGPIAFG